MSSIVPLLGITAILLTAVGSYRFSAYFINSSALAALTAAGTTMSFMILFPYVTFLMGLSVLIAPAVIVSKKTSLFPSMKNTIESNAESLQKKVEASNDLASVNSEAVLDPYEVDEENDEFVCEKCSTVYEQRAPDYCTACGSQMGGEK